MLLGEDETVLRLFPVLRRAWALQGEQAHGAITGCNTKRVLFGAINLRTGHRLLLRRPNMEQAHFQAFLRLVREAYPGCPIALLLDEAPGHRTAKSQRLTAQLDIALIWLPKQCAELNVMDQRWRELKGHISANYQYPTIEEHAAAAEQWIRSLTPTEALRKAGIRAEPLKCEAEQFPRRTDISAVSAPLKESFRLKLFRSSLRSKHFWLKSFIK